MKLMHGAGGPTEGACWMSAISFYAMEEWSDHPECVCPVIRTLAIRLNDATPLSEMEETIGANLFAPVGTRGNAELERQRAFRAADWAVREIAPISLRARGLEDQAKKLESLNPIVDAETAKAADEAARAYAYASAAAYAYAYASATAAAYAYAYASARAATYAYAAAYAAAAAAAAADAATAERDIRNRWMDLILELCEMGREDLREHREREHVISCLREGVFTDVGAQAENGEG